MRHAAVAAVGLAVLLGACSGGPPRRPANPAAVPDAIPRAEPRSPYGNPPSYVVDGRRYAVLPTARGYDQRGVASWYGPDFDGGRTSSGERYDMYAMTAAHKTLPLPCYVRVTNLQNGRSVVVKINDRGPFVDNRIIDLSYSAAARLDMIRDGTALVEVRAVGVDAGGGASPPEPPPVVPEKRFYVQAGAFADELNARRLADRLAASGFNDVQVQPGRSGGRQLYRVRLGPLESVADFDSIVARMHASGFPDAILAAD